MHLIYLNPGYEFISHSFFFLSVLIEVEMFFWVVGFLLCFLEGEGGCKGQYGHKLCQMKRINK